jgi:hypothetical protein
MVANFTEGSIGSIFGVVRITGLYGAMIQKTASSKISVVASRLILLQRHIRE